MWGPLVFAGPSSSILIRQLPSESRYLAPNLYHEISFKIWDRSWKLTYQNHDMLVQQRPTMLNLTDILNSSHLLLKFNSLIHIPQKPFQMSWLKNNIWINFNSYTPHFTKLGYEVLLDLLKQATAVGQPFKLVCKMLAVLHEPFADEHNSIRRVAGGKQIYKLLNTQKD